MNTQETLSKERLKIGLIGAQGDLGQALIQRFAESGFEGELIVSGGRGQSAALVENVDLVMLAVRPMQLAEVSREVRGHLKGSVLTFSAATPEAALEENLGSKVVRAMTDIDFNQVIAMSDDQSRGLLSALSKNPLMEVSTETPLDRFTVFVGCLPGVVAWQLLNNREKALDWLQHYFLFIQEKLGVTEDLLQKILFKGLMDQDLAATIKRIGKEGSITESLIQQLERNPSSSLEELYAAGWARTARVREAVATSLKTQ